MSEVFTPIPEALERFKNGEFLIVMDDEDRENEGDLVIAAEHITPAKMAFLVRESSGYICAPLSNARADRLKLPLMLPPSTQTDRHHTAYTITVDYAIGTTTGISAGDRAKTCQMLANDEVKAEEFTRPGHVVPLRAVDGLLKERQGHTETAVQLCLSSGCKDAAVICELVREEDGMMQRLPDCVEFGKKHNIGIITIKSFKKYLEEQ
ncbi:3,4-dihydroxy-2-butanone-4-phosphate synthase [Saccharomycopsis crataegensis]|uniref:3,4-dihydroxy-2-butanone 4-phosphate synthase n=1 Tax=Saccharomycopsis crataegensis TaxID=43959 RepID=A0AAV5QVK6_9ASCO|nr:3,4-dihydroxy-2-butanone-4-phosphate synthase [Saccharomycopsis crataegensis]